MAIGRDAHFLPGMTADRKSVMSNISRHSMFAVTSKSVAVAPELTLALATTRKYSDQTLRTQSTGGFSSFNEHDGSPGSRTVASRPTHFEIALAPGSGAFLAEDAPTGNFATFPQSRFRLLLRVVVPVHGTVGVAIHCPTDYLDRAQLEPAVSYGAAVWIETDGLGTKRYRVGGRDVSTATHTTRRYASDLAAANEADGTSSETWEIVVEGQRCLAVVLSGALRFSFRTWPTGGHVCFFGTGPQEVACSARWLQLGTAMVAKPRAPPLFHPVLLPVPDHKSIHDQREMHQAQQMARFAVESSSHVFVPALKDVLRKKAQIQHLKKCGSRQLRQKPWEISKWYQDPLAFQQLKLTQTKQRQEMKKHSVMTTKGKKKTREVLDSSLKSGSWSSASAGVDRQELPPQRRLKKQQVAALKALHSKFDKHQNGWVETSDVANVLSTFLGYRNLPAQEAEKAVQAVTSYTAVEFDELLEIFIVFNDSEEQHLHQLFTNKFGEDGRASLEEIKVLMDTLGEVFFPWVIAVTVGGDQCEVDKHAFVAALRELRKNCGFTRTDRVYLEDLFAKFDLDGSGVLSTEELRRIIRYQGYEIGDDVFADLVAAVDTDKSGEIDMAEFLPAMRIFSEIKASTVKAIFNNHRSGEVIFKGDLFACIKEVGYHPTLQSVEEALAHVDREQRGEIRYGGFLELLDFLRKTEGFTQAEIAEFKEHFVKFDKDGSGEIATEEMGPLLRYLGYPTSTHLLQGLVSDVDVDASGEIDFVEFLKLLRKFRNRELQLLETNFERYGDRDAKPGHVLISPEYLRGVFFELGWDVNAQFLEQCHAGLLDPLSELLTYEAYMTAVRRYRDLELVEFRRCAGFAPDVVEAYLAVFQEHDTSGDGQLTVAELLPVLAALGKTPTTVIQQQQLGLAIKEVDEDESGEIDFEEFLQLMRKFLDDSVAAQIRKEKDCYERCGFTAEEIEQWRQVFVQFDEDESGEIDEMEGKQLLTRLGLNLNMRAMHNQYRELFEDADEDQNHLLDFPEFLLLMRDLVDIDFGGVSTKFGALPRPSSKGSDEREKRQQRRLQRRRQRKGVDDDTDSNATAEPTFSEPQMTQTRFSQRFLRKSQFGPL